MWQHSWTKVRSSSASSSSTNSGMWKVMVASRYSQSTWVQALEPGCSVHRSLSYSRRTVHHFNPNGVIHLSAHCRMRSLVTLKSSVFILHQAPQLILGLLRLRSEE